jgi:hypothetical protein
MREHRKHDRELTLKTAKIVSSDRLSAACAILNISDGGACILVSNPLEVPDAFNLVTDFDGTIHGCDVAWRAGNRVGVAFRPRRPE